tara:strand:+ start:729 stop:1379 length:651 start_codon:yes stop_codon:yes gene_type:complete
MGTRSLLLFDLDGTLVDTAPEMHTALNILLREKGMSPVKYDDVRPFVSHGVMGIFTAVFDDNPKINGDRYNRYLVLYEQILGSEASLFDGMNMVIKQLDEDNHLWGVVTNKSHRFAKPLLQKLGIIDKAICLITRDDVQFAKPHPQPILEALKKVKFKQSQHCYYIGDSLKDIESARSAGIKSIACSYGYRTKDDHPEKWGADFCIDKPIEILNVI